jgi:5,10-methylenetetrahydromethanopterin reductase
MNLSISGTANTVEGLKAQISAAGALGYNSFWTPQIFDLDALTALAVIANEVSDIRVGTAVVPTYPRHPMMLAQQALTVNQVASGRLDLGIGLSHQPVVEGMWGIPFDRPLGHMRDYLTILMALLHEGEISHSGTAVTSRGAIGVNAEAPPVFVAALGPQMLELAGQMADGTLTWMTGPVTIGEHTAPIIRAAAKSSERPGPQVIASVAVCITDDVDAARERAATDFGFYGQLPSYRAMLDREGMENSWDLALIGSFDDVADGLGRYSDAGATTVVAAPFGTAADREHTMSELAQLL